MPAPNMLLAPGAIEPRYAPAAATCTTPDLSSLHQQWRHEPIRSNVVYFKNLVQRNSCLMKATLGNIHQLRS